MPCWSPSLLVDSTKSLHSPGSNDLFAAAKDWQRLSETATGDTSPAPCQVSAARSTAAAFFEAWADSVIFQRDDKTIEAMMQRSEIPAKQIVSIIKEFPSQIKAMASRLSASNEGPFPLCHDDFLHSNIMVDENFCVTGIIHWEGACTVPWELVAFPEFLQAMPPSFDLPQKYDAHGQPLDEELRQTWRERQDYTEMVRSAEVGDNLLSTCLGSNRSQALAYAYGAFTSIGKLGFYDKVIRRVGEGELETLVSKS
jgi:hypothetical protein